MPGSPSLIVEISFLMVPCFLFLRVKFSFDTMDSVSVSVVTFSVHSVILSILNYGIFITVGHICKPNVLTYLGRGKVTQLGLVEEVQI